MVQTLKISPREYAFYITPIFLTGFAYGWENGSLGGILDMDQFLDYFDTPSAFRQGVLTSGLQAGEFGGSLTLGYLLADRLGRRLTILTGLAIYLVGQIILTASVSQAQFIAARVINGFGAGALFQTMSLYTAEISPPSIRGQMTATLNTGIGLGLVVTYWVQYGTATIASNASWRIPLGLQIVPAVMIVALMIRRPETPRWLIRHGRSAEALQVLAMLHAQGDEDNEFVNAEFNEIQVAVEYDLEMSNKSPSYFQLIFGKKYRRRTALGIGAQFLQQISGPNIVLYYASKVFAQTGASGTEAVLLANGIGSALLFVSSLHLNIMMDHYGRRKPLIFGPLAMGICLIIVGSLMATYGSPYFNTTSQALEFNFSDASAGHACIAFMFLYEVCFGGFYSSVPWTYPNEVWSVEARARGTAMSTATNWFCNFWLGLYIPTALNEAGWKLYLVFGGICVAISVISYLFFPETGSRSLEELELLFVEGRSAWVLRDAVATSKGSLLPHDLSEGTGAAKDLETALGIHRGSVDGDDEKCQVEYLDQL